jgi:hypothetical protein
MDGSTDTEMPLRVQRRTVDHCGFVECKERTPRQGHWPVGSEALILESEPQIALPVNLTEWLRGKLVTAHKQIDLL